LHQQARIVTICLFTLGDTVETETIRIDFEVYKALTSLRASSEISYNDVLRSLLRLPPTSGRTRGAKGPDSAWISKGIAFPNGTEFRGRYKGRSYAGIVEGGALVVNGKRYSSPSPAAISITGTQTDGWRFWECRRPGDSSWATIKTLRQ
jgi:hypothetical protein